MIYLDTHVIVWLYSGELHKLSDVAKQQIEQNDLFISPMVKLEVQYLHEIKRITVTAADIIATLAKQIALKTCMAAFDDVIVHAQSIHWCRDPFDRIIVAHAAIHKAPLLTKDEVISKHYKWAVW